MDNDSINRGEVVRMPEYADLQRLLVGIMLNECDMRRIIRDELARAFDAEPPRLDKKEVPTAREHIQISDADNVPVIEVSDGQDVETRAAQPEDVPRPANSNNMSQAVGIHLDSFLARTKSGPKSKFEKFVQGEKFETFFAILIFINALVMCFQTQCRGRFHAAKLGVFENVTPCSDQVPNIRSLFKVANWMFGTLFTTELVLKILAERWNFFWQFWNWLDGAIVAAWIMTQSNLDVGLNPLIVRPVRLAKLGRLIRLFHKMQAFDPLYTIITALKGAFFAFAWSAVLMIAIQAFVALVLCDLLLMIYFSNDSYPLEKRKELFLFFGTFTRTMFTMFELTLANWTPTIRLLSENVSEYFMVFGVLYKLSVGFSVVSILNAVFMKETFKVAETDDMLMVRQKTYASKLFKKKIVRLLTAADENDDGLVEFEGFEKTVSTPDVKFWLASMEIVWWDTRNFWSLLSAGQEKVAVPELATRMSKLKGQARSIAIESVRNDVGMLKKLMQDIHRQSPTSQTQFV